MPHTYPIMLDVADRLIIIVGGGSVAVRKAKTLIECGATRVRCISPEIDPEMPGVRTGVYSRRERILLLVFIPARSRPTCASRGRYNDRRRPQSFPLHYDLLTHRSVRGIIHR